MKSLPQQYDHWRGPQGGAGGLGRGAGGFGGSGGGGGGGGGILGGKLSFLLSLLMVCYANAFDLQRKILL